MRRRVRTRTLTVGAVVLAIAAIVVTVRAVGNTDARADPTPRSATPPLPTDTESSTTTSSAAPASPVEAPDPAPFPVERIDVTVTDPELGGRTVRIAVWYPLRGGPAPLVVFAHGYATSPDTYAMFLADLASNGYVVAAPRSNATRSYIGGASPDDAVPDPSSDLSDPSETAAIASVATSIHFVEADADPDQPPSDEGIAEPADDVVFDFDDQRLDIVATIDVMLGADRPDELEGRVSQDPVGVIGHSDGGISASAAAFNSVARDERVGAAVIASGDYGYFGGTWFPAGGPALLALHGEADGVNPISSSTRLFDADAGGPRYLVIAHGAGHLGLLVTDPPESAVVTLIADYFAAYLTGEVSARARIELDTDGSVLDLVAVA